MAVSLETEPEHKPSQDGEKASRPRRALFALFFPAAVFYVLWWFFAGENESWAFFQGRTGEDSFPRYYLSIMMVFGSVVAGSTSQGGASVAFPIMTLMFNILPSTARDFCFMIQSVGMTSAAFSIAVMRVRFEFVSLVICTVGGILGVVFGLEWIAPLLPASYVELYSVAVAVTFGFALYWALGVQNESVTDEITGLSENGRGLPFWKVWVLLLVGMVGGVFSALFGSGIDTCAFVALTCLFRVSEKVATPTTVVLMAVNTCVGFLYREFAMGGVAEDAWSYFLVCIPIVVIGGPFGSVVASHFRRSLLIPLVYAFDAFQLVLALAVVKPWTEETPLLCVTSAAITILGLVFVKCMAKMGERMMQWQILPTHDKVPTSS
ncbi:hypothetical protein BSKO_10909 [Bryopsis sp. KO-2023]|nr:hypothetical protein BSKO_10909 [Bryopsis sp. KO-2023]